MLLATVLAAVALAVGGLAGTVGATAQELLTGELASEETFASQRSETRRRPTRHRVPERPRSRRWPRLPQARPRPPVVLARGTPRRGPPTFTD